MLLREDASVTEADSGVEVLRALAEVRHMLDRVASERERPDLSAARSLGVSRYSGGIATVEVFFYLTDADDVEAEWFAEARHTPGRTGWVVQRTVAVQKSVNGEVTNLGETSFQKWSARIPPRLRPNCPAWSRNFLRWSRLARGDSALRWASVRECHMRAVCMQSGRPSSWLRLMWTVSSPKLTADGCGRKGAGDEAT
jgi:hypothetical protein